MKRYRLENTVVDTEKASRSYKLGSRSCGYGACTRTLYRSRRGRWYVENFYNWTEDNKTLDNAEWVSPEEAARLMLAAGLEVPDELKKVADEVSE